MIRRITIVRTTLFLLSCSLILGFNINLFTKDYGFSKSFNLKTVNLGNSASINTYDIDSSILSEVVEYNLLSKTKSIRKKAVSAKESAIQPYIPPERESIDDDLKMSYPFPPDDRSKVTSTSDYPWSTICKLFIIAEDGTEFIGSGFVIDEFHILTCGHCIYIHEHGGWVDEVEVVPGMDGSYKPFGSAYAIDFITYTGWVDDEMEEHDWALVNLDRNIGFLTGWMGIQTDNPTSSIYTGTLHTAGYPGDLGEGNYMYYDSDVGYDADTYNHWYWMDTAAGQSGSPVWREDNEGDPYVLSINAYDYENGEYPNMGTRINSNKFDDLFSWLEEDSSSAPIDKAELLDAGIYSNISINTVYSGKTLFSIFCDVKNEGTATVPSFKVNFYASENLSITSSGNLIGTKTVYDLEPFEYKSADWTGIFPSNISEGFYFVGWIIDPENEIEEWDESNNVFFDVTFYIEVIKRDISNPMEFIFIPILVVIGVIITVIATAIILMRRRRYPKLDIYKYVKSYSPELGPTPQQKYPTTSQEIIKFCPNCGRNVTLQGQRFCSTCGFDFRENSEL